MANRKCNVYLLVHHSEKPYDEYMSIIGVELTKQKALKSAKKYLVDMGIVPECEIEELSASSGDAHIGGYRCKKKTNRRSKDWCPDDELCHEVRVSRIP